MHASYKRTMKVFSLLMQDIFVRGKSFIQWPGEKLIFHFQCINKKPFQ